MFGRKKTKGADPVDPDLPITPMLDMSFQLMAFFIFTFRPAPTEGQILLALPKSEGGGQGLPSPSDDKPINFVVKVLSAGNGTIAGMTISEKDSPDIRPVDLGADVKRFQGELQKRFAEQKKNPPKLTLEIGDGLLQEYVVQLLDIAIGIGFTDIAPLPMDVKRR
jgi:biopolymer transport protein ExbD